MGNTANIINFESRYAAVFKQLNLEWLELHFRVEPIDEKVRSRPEDIQRDGGAIWLAQDGGTIVGCCALIAKGNRIYELSKMAVTASAQGKGLGRSLLEATVKGFADLDGRQLFLETNTALKAAIALYESAGFEHQQRPRSSPYERANVYMVYTDEDRLKTERQNR
jgi:N-acetylglutamate synthase-like GNAT family acetyltransferase